MEANLTITNIRTVYDGEFHPGTFPRKAVGRHCDCFVYYLYGKAEYLFENRSFTATPQKFIYLAKDSFYEIKVLEKSKFICIDFDFSAAAPQDSNAFDCNAHAAKNLFQKILHTQNGNMAYSMPQAFADTYNLYAEAIRAEHKTYAKSNAIATDITAYILRHYTEVDFNIPKLAKHFNISEVHLRRIFKQSALATPIQYINHLKIAKAKNMLRISNYTISEIALSVGFHDPYYFSKFFKKETGMTPSTYRQNADAYF